MSYIMSRSDTIFYSLLSTLCSLLFALFGVDLMKRIIVGITGASGAVLGERLVRFLLKAGHEVHAIISPSGVEVFREELGISLGKNYADIGRNFLRHYSDKIGRAHV